MVMFVSYSRFAEKYFRWIGNLQILQRPTEYHIYMFYEYKLFSTVKHVNSWITNYFKDDGHQILLMELAFNVSRLAIWSRG